LVFHGQGRFEVDDGHLPHEPAAMITAPLILLAIPSVVAGLFVGNMVFGDFFDGAIFVLAEHDVLAHHAESYHGIFAFVVHGLQAPPFWLAVSGVATAYFLYIKRPDIPAKIQQRFMWLYKVLDNKYGFDTFNDKVFAGGSRLIGRIFWQIGDQVLIDGAMVNGTAKTVGLVAKVARKIQSGYLYHYAFAMILGVWLLLTLFVA